MSRPIDRRSLLKAFAASTALGLACRGEAAELKFGPATPFSFEGLKEAARRIARAPYKAPSRPAPDVLDQIDYDAWGKIRFDNEAAPFAKGPGRYPVTFFHLGRYFQKPVDIHLIEGANARPILYDPSYFEMPADSPAHKLPPGAGFAGFRFQEARDGKLDWKKNDWVAFLGASYFRAIGELYQFGLSARGVAIDPAIGGKAEEFPDYTRVYIGPQKNDIVSVYALLEGPSIAGAYKFLMTRDKGVVMDIEQALFLRKDVERIGLAPCTSMYWFSETRKAIAVDWRPEVHDSDGLALWTGAGERIWRPLNNPGRVMVSAFADDNPRGFGLMQRDRDFDHYGDGVYYDRRPSLWVEPIGQWGEGAVQLIEIPTDDEIHDNIVAMWVPRAPAKAGGEYHLRYKLHWLANEPYAGPLARCVATRLGNGGQPGQTRPKGVRKFLVEFLGGPLETIPFGVKPEPVLWASRGAFTNYKLTEAVPDGIVGHWRTQFDLAVEGDEPVEMRCYLRAGDQVMSETWSYQYHPF